MLGSKPDVPVIVGYVVSERCKRFIKAWLILNMS